MKIINGSKMKMTRQVGTIQGILCLYVYKVYLFLIVFFFLTEPTYMKIH